MKNKKSLLLLIVLAALLAITASSALAFTSTQAKKTQVGVILNNDYVWAKAFFKGEGNAIALDNSGNVYTTGYFYGTVDFDPGAGTANLTSAGSADVFINKLDSDGNFIWAKAFGGINQLIGDAIAVDDSGNVYISGSFEGIADFDPSGSTVSLTSAGQSDIFVSKLDTDGNFVWAKALGGTSYDYGYGIAVDNNGNIYTVGNFTDTADFDPSTGVANLASAGGSDIFVSKLDANGAFVWAKAMGGTSYNYGYGIAVDIGGNVYTTGIFSETVDFDPSVEGTTNLIVAGFDDIFVSKLDTNGDFIWAKAMGGTGDDKGAAITVDSSGNVYTTGKFRDTADFDPGIDIANLTSAGSWDVFVNKLDTNGDFVWVKAMSGINEVVGYAIAVNNSGDVYTTGLFKNTADFNPGIDIANLTSAGSWDVFVSKLDSTGDFVWASAFGGYNNDVGNAIVLGSNDNVYTTGIFRDTADFDPSAGIANLSTSINEVAVFVSKLGSPPIPPIPTELNASDGEFTDKVQITWTAATDTARYEIYRDTGGSVTKVGETESETTFNDKTVVPGTTYTYGVKACNVSGCSATSTTDTGYLKLASPLNLQASDGTYSNKVKVTWNSVAGATNYEVYRHDGTSWVKRATTTTLVYNDTATTPLITYKYRVKACNANGCSGFSTLNTGYRGKLVTAQLVRNLGFEVDTNNDGIPNFWVRASNNKLDKRICSPGAKHLGKCGYRFLGDNVARKDWIRQNLSVKAINKGGGHNGDKLILSFYARSIGLELADGAYVLVKVKNTATNKQQVIRVNLTGTHAYKRFTKTLKVTIGNYDQVWVYVYANGTTNENLYIDNVTVRLQYIQKK